MSAARTTDPPVDLPDLAVEPLGLDHWPAVREIYAEACPPATPRSRPNPPAGRVSAPATCRITSWWRTMSVGYSAGPHSPLCQTAAPTRVSRRTACMSPSTRAAAVLAAACSPSWSRAPRRRHLDGPGGDLPREHCERRLAPCLQLPHRRRSRTARQATTACGATCCCSSGAAGGSRDSRARSQGAR